MKKITKLLSVFVLAGAIGTGAGALAGCNTHSHTYEEGWTTKDGYHWHAADCEHEDEKSDYGKCVDTNTDGKCDTCGKDMPKTSTGDTLQAPEGAKDIIVEGVTTEYVLKDEEGKRAANIPLTGFSVYFANEKGQKVGTDPVPAANWTATLKLGSETVTDNTKVTKEGDYTLSVSLVKVSYDKSKPIQIKVKNPIAALQLVTADAKLEQDQGTTDEMKPTWKFKAVRANGDVEDIAATELNISTYDTMEVGTQEVTVSLKANSDVFVKFNITINPNASIKTQSFAVNAATFSTGEYKTTDLDAAHGVSTTGTVTVDANEKEVGDKLFLQRFKLSGIYKTENSIKLSNVNSKTGLDAGATVKTRVTVYAISGNGTNSRWIGLLKDGGSLDTDIQQPVLLNGSEVTKVEFEITEAGDYHIATFDKKYFPDSEKLEAGSNGGINIYYIQVDKIITNDSTATNTPLAGSLALHALKLDETSLASVKKDYKVGDQINYAGLEATAIYYNPVTAAFNKVALGDLSLLDPSKIEVTVDMTQPGEKVTVTVTYKGENSDSASATYEVTVESAITGVTGVTAALKSGISTSVEAGTKFTLNKTDIEIKIVGGNTTATTDFTAKENNSDVSFPAELEIGNHTLVLTVTVKEGDGPDAPTVTFENIELKINVTQQAAAANIQQFVNVYSADGVSANGTITSNNLFEAVADGAMTYGNEQSFAATESNKQVKITTQFIKGNGDALEANSESTVTVVTSGLGTNQTSAADTKTNTFTITAKENITLWIYVTTSDGTFKSNKPGKLYATIDSTDCKFSGEGVISTTGTDYLATGTSRLAPSTIKVTLTKNQVLKICGAGDSSGVKTWLLGLEAQKNTTPEAASLTVETPVAVMPSKKEY